MTLLKINSKKKDIGQNKTTANKRFGVMRGVCSQKVLREFELTVSEAKVCRPCEHLRSPARTPSRQPLGASSAKVQQTITFENKTEVKYGNN